VAEKIQSFKYSIRKTNFLIEAKATMEKTSFLKYKKKEKRHFEAMFKTPTTFVML
jgi:hypothetical protein